MTDAQRPAAGGEQDGQFVRVADRLKSAADRLRNYPSADAFVERILGVVAEQIRIASLRAGNIRRDPISGRQWHGATYCGAEVGITCECFADALELAALLLPPDATTSEVTS